MPRKFTERFGFEEPGMPERKKMVMTLAIKRIAEEFMSQPTFTRSEFNDGIATHTREHDTFNLNIIPKTLNNLVTAGWVQELGNNNFKISQLGARMAELNES